MVKKVLAIFAHPDDESFGPGGTLALWASQGAQIRLICTTHGQAGNNHTSDNLSIIREKELNAAVKTLGVASVSLLDYPDGKLCNHDIKKLKQHFIREITEYRPDTILTFNLNGVSGHIDHMVIASAVTSAFDATHTASKLYYFSNSLVCSKRITDYFVHFPDGITRKQADEIIDVTSVWEKKVQAMFMHVSQHKDAQALLDICKDQPKEEYFLIRKK